MLRHREFRRNFKHNLLLAVLFSIVAGIINVTGLILFEVFPTNLTGHVGEFALSINSREWTSTYKVLVWILSFLLGAFFASFMTNILDRIYPRLSYVIPIIVEIACLLLVILPDSAFLMLDKEGTKLPLLFFSMGLQNGIVSVVSGNIVRTTHLTGMVTDFGIGMSELMLSQGERKKNQEKVILCGTIIISFLLGGIIGGYYTPIYGAKAIYIPIAILAFMISFDFLRTNYLILKRKLRDI